MIRFLFLISYTVLSYQFSLDKSAISRQTKKLNIISLAPISICNYNNIEYSLEFGFGNPPQPLKLSIFLIPNFTWVPSSSSGCHWSKNRFESSLSASFKSSERYSTESFFYGEVSGEFVSDEVKIGDLTVEDQEFFLAFQDHGFEDMIADGGLGLSLNNGKSFVQLLYDNDWIEEPVFSLYLTNADVRNCIQDTFTLGEYSFNNYSNGQDPSFIQIIDEYFWMGSIEGFSIGKEIKNISISNVYFEIGYSFLVMPLENYDSFRDEVYEKLSGCYENDELIYCDCEIGKYAKFPDLSFVVNGTDYVVHAENYIYFQDDYCLLMVFGYRNIWLLGQPFFREYYSVFNVKDRVIQLAPAYRENYEFNQFYTVFQDGIYVGCFGLIAVGVWILGKREGGVYYFRID